MSLNGNDLLRGNLAQRLEPCVRRFGRLEPECCDDTLAKLRLEVRDLQLSSVLGLVRAGFAVAQSRRAAVFDDLGRVHGALGQHANHRFPLGVLWRRL